MTNVIIGLLYILFILVGLIFALVGLYLAKLIKNVGKKHKEAYMEYLKAITGGTYAGLFLLVLITLLDVYKEHGISLASWVATGMGIFTISLIIVLGATSYIKMFKPKE